MPPAARRLLLDADEARVLLEVSGVVLPPGFVGLEGAPGPRDEHDEVVGRLVERGVLAGVGGDVRAVEPVLVNLLVVSSPEVSISVEGSRRGAGLKAWYAVRGPVGASLFARDRGGLELSMFAAESLGVELERAVPPVDALASGLHMHTAGAAPQPAATRPPLSGRVPLDALADPEAPLRAALGDHVDHVDAGDGVWSDGLLGEEQRRLMARVRAEADGQLRFLVLGAEGGESWTVPVLWLCSSAGWVVAEPVAATDEERAAGQTRVVALRPVDRAEVGASLAPAVSTVLDALSARPGSTGVVETAGGRS